jgi:hypothetical protein
MEKEAKIPLAGLWRNETKDGKTYLSGYLGEAKILIFPNGFKETEKQPDYRMYLVENKREKQAEVKKVQNFEDVSF